MPGSNVFKSFPWFVLAVLMPKWRIWPQMAIQRGKVFTGSTWKSILHVFLWFRWQYCRWGKVNHLHQILIKAKNRFREQFESTNWPTPLTIQRLIPGTLLVLDQWRAEVVCTWDKVRTRIRVCSDKVSLWESWSPVCRVGSFHPGTVPRPADPTGFRSCGGSRVSGPPWGWAALQGLSQTLPWEESLCWRCGQGIHRYPGFVHFPEASLPPKKHHSVPVVKAEAELQSPEFWGVQAHSDVGVLEGTPNLDLEAGGQKSLLLILENHLLQKEKERGKTMNYIILQFGTNWWFNNYRLNFTG